MLFLKSIIILLFVTSSVVWAHWHTAYSHENWTNYKNPNWMGKVDGNISIKKLSLPGTHDSMAYNVSNIAWRNIETQTLSLSSQLEAGIRVFDIRVRHFHNGFYIHHGSVFLNATFNDVLKTMNNFLNQHPTEALLVRLKEEHTPSDNTRSFTDTFENYRNQYSRIWRAGKQNPTLNEVRGKIVILQNFSGKEYGISYSSFHIQDNYKLSSNWDLYDTKWTPIKRQLSAANSNYKNGAYINYLSGNGGAFPFFIASGHSSAGTSASRLSTGLTTPGWKNSYPDFPRVNCFIGICTIAFEGTNVLTYDYINKNKLGYVGIVMADFPGDGLIDTIIKLNFPIEVNKVYQIFAVHSNKVIDLSATNNNAPIVQWSGHNGSHQRWKVFKNNDGSYSFQVQSPGYGCIAREANSNKIVQRNCNVEGTKWSIERNDDNSYRIGLVENGNVNRYLDVEASSQRNGAQLIVYPYYNTPNQKWKFTEK